MINLTIIIKNPDKIEEFNLIWSEISSKYKLDKYFTITVIKSLNEYCDKIKNDFMKNVNNSDKEKNPAFACLTEDIIYIDNYFWDITGDDEKECVIVHELGHLKYPLKIREKNPLITDKLGCLTSEFLADRFFLETKKELLNIRYEDSIKEYKNLLSNVTKNDFEKLVQCFYVLKGFKILQEDSFENELLDKVKKKIKEFISDENFCKLCELINEFLQDHSNEDKYSEIIKLYEEMELDILN